jgi:phage terminase large subunit
VSRTRVEIPQKLLPLFQPKRYKILHGGRGSGKSWSIARALVALGASKPIRVLCARETQKSIQESVHRLLKDQISLLGLDALYEIQENRILGSNGTEFTFAGIRQQGVANMKSYEGTDICWVEEAQVVTRKSWDVLIPTIRKPASEIWISFNPELDTDETFTRFVAHPPSDSWVCEVNWSDNPWFPPELDKERRDWLDRDPQGYLTVWEGRCRPAVDGAIYASEIEALQREGRIRSVPYDPTLKVHTVWDLGWNDSMSIIFVQKVASEVRIIDFIEDSHRTIDSYVMEIESRKWRWGTDFIPHDGAHKNFQTGRSTQNLLETLGRRVTVLPRGSPEEGIRIARMVFPRAYFDTDKTMELVNHLKRYRRAINQVTQEAGAPLHDEHSHAADAWRYLAESLEMMSNDDWGKPIATNTKWVV